MTYGAKESNSKEGLGLMTLIAGITALTAGWAYAPGALQILIVLLGIAGIVGGFAVMKTAKA